MLKITIFLAIWFPIQSIFSFSNEEFSKIYQMTISLGIEEYASEDYAKIQEILSKEPLDDIERKKAYSILERATLRNLPKVLQKQQSFAIESLSLAEESFAECLSIDYWNLAKDAHSEAEVLSAGYSRRIYEINDENNELKRATLFLALIGDIQSALTKEEDSIQFSRKAISLSLAQSPALLDSQGDIKDTLSLFKKIRPPEKNDTVELKLLEKEIDDAFTLIQSGKIRTGFMILDGMRQKLNDMVLGDFKLYASARISLGKSKWQEAQDLLEKERARFSDDPDILLQLEDNLRAAHESLEIAESLFQNEKFIDSIAKSEDSLFLTERFQEDIELAVVPETKLYSDEVETTPKRKHPTHHEVKRGDTLVQISNLYYGTYRKWKDIYKLNKKTISNPARIFPSQKILLPPKK